MKDELSDSIFHKEAEDILEKCREIFNLKIKKEEKKKLEKEAASYLRSKIEILINCVKYDILLFEEEFLDNINKKEIIESFVSVQQKLGRIIEYAIRVKVGKDKNPLFFFSFCSCMYDICKLELGSRYYNHPKGYIYRIIDLLLMKSFEREEED